MKPPSKIKIGGHDYAVKHMRDPHFFGEAVMGLFKSNEQEIILSNKWLEKKPTREAEVLLHEVMHGIVHHTGMLEVIDDRKQRDSLEEHIVSVMANGVIAVLKDNPAFLNYLKENTSGTS